MNKEKCKSCVHHSNGCPGGLDDCKDYEDGHTLSND